MGRHSVVPRYTVLAVPDIARASLANFVAVPANRDPRNDQQQRRIRCTSRAIRQTGKTLHIIKLSCWASAANHEENRQLGFLHVNIRLQVGSEVHLSRNLQQENPVFLHSELETSYAEKHAVLGACKETPIADCLELS